MATITPPAPTTSTYSQVQMTAWLRGLLTIAWADGNFDATEREMISELTRDELAPCLDVDQFEPIPAAELAEQLGNSPKIRENFLRTAVMVAVADGLYSMSEDQMLQSFCQALSLDATVLDAFRATFPTADPALKTVPGPSKLSSTPLGSDAPAMESGVASPLPAVGPASRLQRPLDRGTGLDVLKPARSWLDGLEVDDPRLARFLCKMIPAQCPFERDVKLFGRKVIHIPPMCKLNPLYDQLVGLRFRSLCYLADDCGEDVSQYC